MSYALLTTADGSSAGFQSGKGARDGSRAYRQFGHNVDLERHLFTADELGFHIEAAGLVEVCRPVRTRGKERDDQAFLLARAE